MNQRQFEIWEKQKRREYRIELDKLQDDFAGRGLTFSGARIRAEKDLKEKYDSEIEIMRLGLNEDTKKEHVAVTLNKSARNNVFINSKIDGGVEIAGHGNSFIETKINTLKKEHPFWFWFGTIGTTIGIITGLMFLAQYFGVLSSSWSDKMPLIPVSGNISTTTPNLADIFLKTNSMLDLEKENFVKDFENGPVYAVGAVFDNINSSGDHFIVRMAVERNAIGCAFNSDFKKELLLLKKGDKVNFYGIFTGSGLSGYGAVNPWYITDCILLK